MKKQVVALFLGMLLVGNFQGVCNAEETFRIGFAEKDLSNEFQNALTEGVKAECQARGWECTVLVADSSVENQMQAVETFIADGYDLILMNTVDSEAGTSIAELAQDAGIPMIEIDANINDPAAVVTTVYSPNYGNGVVVGEFIATDFGEDEEITAAVICGNKGSKGGQDRTEGEITGIIKGRTGVSEEEAYEAGKEMYQELVDKGQAYNEEANFRIVSQGWGDWTEEGGLAAMEDILAANDNINCLLGENDSMLIGALQAIESAGRTDEIRIYAAADAMKAALELISDPDSIYKATGLNAPAKVAAKAFEVADQILVEGADWESFGEEVLTEPICVTIDNVDEYYDPDALF